MCGANQSCKAQGIRDNVSKIQPENTRLRFAPALIDKSQSDGAKANQDFRKTKKSQEAAAPLNREQGSQTYSNSLFELQHDDLGIRSQPQRRSPGSRSARSKDLHLPDTA